MSAWVMRVMPSVDHLGARNDHLEFLDAALDKALLFAGGMVFGVFLKVAMRTRFGNRLNNRWALHGFQFLQLDAEAEAISVKQGEDKKVQATVTLGGVDLQAAKQRRKEAMAALRPDTRMVVVNFPHNPTGSLPDRATFQALCALFLFVRPALRRRTNPEVRS